MSSGEEATGARRPPCDPWRRVVPRPTRRSSPRWCRTWRAWTAPRRAGDDRGDARGHGRRRHDEHPRGASEGSVTLPQKHCAQGTRRQPSHHVHARVRHRPAPGRRRPDDRAVRGGEVRVSSRGARGRGNENRARRVAAPRSPRFIRRARWADSGRAAATDLGNGTYDVAVVPTRAGACTCAESGSQSRELALLVDAGGPRRLATAFDRSGLTGWRAGEPACWRSR